MNTLRLIRRTPSRPFGAPSIGAISLQRRVVGGVGIVAVLLLLGAAWTTDATLKRSMLGDVDERLTEAAQRSAVLVDRVLAERRHQVELLAAMPSVVDAARRGGELARYRQLPTLRPDSLERRFARERSQQVDGRTLAYLRGMLATLDAADVIITDDLGYNAVITAPSADFAQSDERWWIEAWSDSATTGATATQDVAVQQPVVELARAVTARRGTAAEQRLGVVKVKFGLHAIDSVLVLGSAKSAVRVDLVDTLGRLIASSGRGDRLRPVPALASIADVVPGSAVMVSDSSGTHRAVVATANDRRWRVIARMDMSGALTPYHDTRLRLLAAVALALMVIVGGLVAVNRFIERRISRPAAELAVVAEAVAGGDLTAEVPALRTHDEIGRLSRAVASMVVELRRLVGAMNGAANQTATMTVEITAGSEEMAAAAGEIATTASDLSRQAGTMAHTIQWLARSSESLASLAVELDAGAQEGVERNGQLKSLALDNRARLEASTTALATLVQEARAGADAVEQLAEASVEVRTFVALVQKLARQSKLLALNAAMEAARAGEHGEGFAVVAGEVRRLAAMSSEAAERTQSVVAGVLKGIDNSRASTERMVDTVRAVRDTTEEGTRSFEEIERSVNGADTWTARVGETARAARALADELRGRTESLATGTESFAAAMEEVAASSEEQSASSEEIAAAASTLAASAERLTKLVANLRLERRDLSSTPPGEHEPQRATQPPAAAHTLAVAT